MRLRRGVSLVAAIATAAAAAAPAQARFDESMPGQRPVAPSVVNHSGGGSTDWALIAAGAAGGIALIGAGTAGSRHVLRRTAHDRVATGT